MRPGTATRPSAVRRVGSLSTCRAPPSRCPRPRRGRSTARTRPSGSTDTRAAARWRASAAGTAGAAGPSKGSSWTCYPLRPRGEVPRQEPLAVMQPARRRPGAARPGQGLKVLVSQTTRFRPRPRPQYQPRRRSALNCLRLAQHCHS